MIQEFQNGSTIHLVSKNLSDHMSIPKIIFRTEHWFSRKELWDIEEGTYYKKFLEIWKEYGNKILKEIVEVVGKEFEEKDIICYTLPLKQKFPSCAFPLLLKLKRIPMHTVYILTHELIHRILNHKPYRGILKLLLNF